MRANQRAIMREKNRIQFDLYLSTDWEKQRCVLKCIIAWACTRAAWLEEGDIKQSLKGIAVRGGIEFFFNVSSFVSGS